jgi:hypothetical protein
VARIAISYRREDSAAITGRIFDRLAARYGSDCVFRDVDNIPLGVDFREYISRTLAETDVTLVVVGKRWFGARRGNRRIDDPDDPVRVEVETALRTGMSVVPILVEGSAMPKADQLPDGLKDLIYRNGLDVDSGLDFDQHIERLFRNIDSILAEIERRHAEAARQGEATRAAEEKRQRAEAARRTEEERQRAEAARRTEEERQRAEATRRAEEGGQQAEATPHAAPAVIRRETTRWRVALAYSALVAVGVLSAVDYYVTSLSHPQKALSQPLPTPPPPGMAEVGEERDMLGDSIKNGTDPADSREFPGRYPQGEFAPVVRHRLTALARSAQALRGAANPEPDGTPGEQLEVQRALRPLGHFQGEAEGGLGPRIRSAVQQFQSFEGAAETGLLSDSQRADLLDMAQRLAKLLDQPAVSPEGVSASAIKGAEQRYARASGLEKLDPAEAAYWYALAASDGDAKALTNLGIIVARGVGTAKPDPLDAILLWLAAAARGEAFAMFNLGGLYERGIGVPVDLAKARSWYQRASALNYPAARAALKRLGP